MSKLHVVRIFLTPHDKQIMKSVIWHVRGSTYYLRWWKKEEEVLRICEMPFRGIVYIPKEWADIYYDLWHY